jgi:transcriptional regulator with XRE-family HTH domain
MAGARRAAYVPVMRSQTLPKLPSAQTASIGERLRHWRQMRRLSQLDLACEAEISTRHLSFIETGRSAPSREMVLRLAESLDVPVRERNGLLLAAGYAPAFQARTLSDPPLRPIREAIDALLVAHEPYPALAVDRHWTLIAANRAIGPLTAGAAPELLKPPVNVLRLSLHPRGVAPRIVNLAEWRDHLLFRLRRQQADSADSDLGDLIEELSAYPCGPSRPRSADALATTIAVPLRLRTEQGTLSFLSATMMFDAPLDATLSEIALETFLPADAATAEFLRLSRSP